MQTLMLPYLETLPTDWQGCAHSFANLVVWNIVIKRQKRDLLYDYFMIATLVAFCISDFVVKLVLKASDQSKISYHDHRPEKKWSWIGMLSEWNQNCPTNISENLYWYTLDSGGLDVCFGVILKSSEKYWIVRLGVTFTSVQQPTVALGEVLDCLAGLQKTKNCYVDCCHLLLQFSSTPADIHYMQKVAVQCSPKFLDIVQIGVDPGCLSISLNICCPPIIHGKVGNGQHQTWVDGAIDGWRLELESLKV